MMKAFNDSHEVYRSNTDEPLSFGRIYYYAIGTTTLKKIYSDIDLTVEISNPQLLTQAGRTLAPVYAGVGDYSVYAYKFNGIDPLTAPDADWSFDHYWDNEGLEASTLDSNEVLFVDTIAELRTVDQSKYDTFGVRGYYEAGDMFDRIYQLVTSTDTDNGGTVIKNPSISGKSWVYKPQNGVVDARVFGIIAGRVETMNGQMQVLDNWANANNFKVHYTSGVYTVTGGTVQANADTDIDNGFSLKNIGGTEFVWQIISGLDCRMTGGLKNTLSTSNSRFIIQEDFVKAQTPKIVNPLWWGVVSDGSHDDYTEFKYCVDSIYYKGTVINITKNIYIKSISSNIVIYNDILFTGNGSIRSSASTGTITFVGIKITNKANVSAFREEFLPCFFNGGLNGFKFENVDGIKSSWFGLITENGSTQDLSLVLSSIDATDGTPFIFDMPLNVFSTPLTYADSKKFNFVHESGLLQNSVQNNSVRLNNLNASIGVKCFAGTGYPIIIQNGEQHLSWWTNSDDSIAIKREAWFKAMTSCVLGSGILNGDEQVGYTDILNRYIDDSYAGSEGNATSLFLSNAKWNGTYSGVHAFDLHDFSFNNIFIDKVECQFGTAGGLIKLHNTTANKLKISGCDLYDDGLRTDSYILSFYGTGALFSFELDSTRASCESLFSVSKPSSSNIHDNEYLSLGGNLTQVGSRFNNNNLVGYSGCHILIDSASVSFSGNHLYYSYVQVEEDSSNTLSCIIDNNKFESSDIQLSGIIINGSGSYVGNLKLIDNHFTGSYSTSQKVIQFTGTFAGSPAIIAKGNTSDVSNLKAPNTRYSGQFAIASGSSYSLDLDALDNVLLFVPTLANRCNSLTIFSDDQHFLFQTNRTTSGVSQIFAISLNVSVNLKSFYYTIKICGDY